MPEVKPINPMGMSDEDIANLDVSQLQLAVESAKESETKETEKEEEEESLPEKEEEDTSEDTSEDENEAEEVSDEPEEEEDEEIPRDIYSGESSSDDESSEEQESTREVESTAPDIIDYKAEYQKLLTPFKANKREVSVETVDEARQLMQMGVAFSDKMKNLKDDLRIVKTLKKNNLFEEDSVNFLIDLAKGKPAAVTKYLKDHNIDPLELDMESESTYTPPSYAISDKEFGFDSVIEDIEDTPTYNRTMNEISNKWDSHSKKILVEYPGLVRTINDQIGDGTYDKIWSVIERERIFGRLVGIPDLEAYKMVGEALAAKGVLNQDSKPVAKPKNKPQDPRLNERKRAASPTRGTPAKKKKVPNMLGLSDEEFEKMSVSQL
jgi:flagellar hook-length control protein FliK